MPEIQRFERKSAERRRTEDPEEEGSILNPQSSILSSRSPTSRSTFQSAAAFCSA
jgi:hypothetical protein